MTTEPAAIRDFALLCPTTAVDFVLSKADFNSDSDGVLGTGMEHERLPTLELSKLLTCYYDKAKVMKCKYNVMSIN